MMQHNKKIVIFYSRLLGVGGAERVALEEARYFSRDYDAKLFTFILEPEALFEYKDVKIFSFNFPNDGQYFRPAQTSRRIISLARELKKNKTALVIACSTAGLYELFFATLIYPIPYVLHVHGTIFWFDDDHTKYALIHRKAFDKIRRSLRGHMEFVAPRISLSLNQKIKLELLAILNYLAVKRAKTVLALSNRMQWEIKQLYGKEAFLVPLRLVPPDFLGSPSEENIRRKLGIDEDAKVVLSIGRLDRRKRLDLLIKAFAQIAKASDNIELVIGGKGSEERKLKELSHDLGLDGKVKFVGFVRESELRDYYAACDVFAYPGWADYALTVYEALALNKRIVCSSEMEMPKNEDIYRAEPVVKDFALKLKEAIDEKTQIRTKATSSETGFELLEKLIQTLI